MSFFAVARSLFVYFSIAGRSALCDSELVPSPRAFIDSKSTLLVVSATAEPQAEAREFMHSTAEYAWLLHSNY